MGQINLPEARKILKGAQRKFGKSILTRLKEPKLILLLNANKNRNKHNEKYL